MLRRIFRIYPLAIVASCLYAALSIPSIDGYRRVMEPAWTLGSLLPNLLLLQNLFRVNSVPIVLWSLPYEVQMYVFLPFLFFILCNRTRQDSVAIWISSAAISLVVMAICPWLWLVQFFQFVPCFMAGAIGSKPAKRNLPAWLWPVAILAFIVAFLPTNGGFVAIQWPLCFLLGFLLPRFRELPDGLLTKGAAVIAKYSFGIYLLHEAAVVVLVPSLGWFGAPLALALTIATSALAYRLIEQPLIAVGKRLSDRINPLYCVPGVDLLSHRAGLWSFGRRVLKYI